ncbi:MAG TPA: hypothetical protein VMV10_22625 [Pirellulales bacterium]|nr:hypothetical protein [Pirellulales bacterium]
MSPQEKRRNVSRVVACAAFIAMTSGQQPAVAADALPTLDDIRQAWSVKAAVIKSVHVEYDVVGTEIADRKEIYEKLHILSMGKQHAVETVSGKKLSRKFVSETRRYELAIKNAREKLKREGKKLPESPSAFLKDYKPMPLESKDYPFELIAPEFDALPLDRIDQWHMFDGEMIYRLAPPQVGKTRRVYQISLPEVKNMYLVGMFYLDLIGHGVRDPGLADDSPLWKRFHLPDAFDVAPFVILGKREEIDGAACVVVEAERFLKLWLDPNLGYAIRRQDVWVEGERRTEARHEDFVEVADGLYFPKTIVRDSLGGPNFSARYRGKPVIRSEITLVTLEVNRGSHEADFEFNPEPGAKVTDARIPTVDAEGKPRERRVWPHAKEVVGYIQPADKADLDKAIRQGQLSSALGKEPTDLRPSFARQYAVIGGIAALAAILVILLWRTRRLRDLKTT